MLIGLSGKAGSGKTTVARYLSTRGYSIRKFAGPIKSMLADLLVWQGVAPEDTTRFLEGDLKEVPTELFGGKSPRHAMQTIGAGWGVGQIHEDFWVNVAMRNLGPGDVIFDDVRFPNEALAIRELGGVVVNIVRDVELEVWKHPTENALTGYEFNYVIHNNDDLDALYNRVHDFLVWCKEYEHGWHRMDAIFRKVQE